LRPYFKDAKLLVCPDDENGGTDMGNTDAPGFDLPHSYIINAWNDYFEPILDPAAFALYMSAHATNGMPENAVKSASDTLLFGEKVSGPPGHHYMDLLQDIGNDVNIIIHNRHSRGTGGKSAGGSNFAFCDGSARFMKAYSTINPINLWAVTDHWRTNSASAGTGTRD
jgi:prepilin-type processing-associated H-X9-DG protein